MASNQDQSLLQCAGCHGELNLELKTLPCLHSYCQQENENGQCPECHDHQSLDKLKEQIDSVTLSGGEMSSKNLVLDKQWVPNRSEMWITSIYFSEEDSHVFLGDAISKSMFEFSESGELIGECNLNFKPSDICLISPEIFVVPDWDFQFIFVERRKVPPFLKVKKVIKTEVNFLSLCKLNESIFAIDVFFQIDSFTKEGEKLRTIKSKESNVNWSLIRADQSAGNFWVIRTYSSEIICFDPNGEKLQLVKIEEEITDFCVNEFRHFYFSNSGGIFSFFPQKMLYKFEERTKADSQIFVSRNKMFVSHKIDNGNYEIKIFKIIN